MLADGHLLAEQAVAVGFFGRDLRVGHGSEGGWEVFGLERRITAAEGNVLRELDGKPALELYRAYLGNLADDLPASGLRFPLAVRESDHAERALVRTLLAIDEDEQSMIFAGDVPQDWSAQLMGADADQLLDGAHAAAGRQSQSWTWTSRCWPSRSPASDAGWCWGGLRRGTRTHAGGPAAGKPAGGLLQLRRAFAVDDRGM